VKFSAAFKKPSEKTIFRLSKLSQALLLPPTRKGVGDKGPIAQSVEQWIENSRVGGSNPSRATPHICLIAANELLLTRT
jgi:hypothetical protein